MIFNDRLAFLDQCIAGEKTQFEKIVSKTVFNTFDRGYDLYRDYIKQKNSITEVTCDVNPDGVTFHFDSVKPLEELISENMPKKGITSIATDKGVDLNIKLIDVVIL